MREICDRVFVWSRLSEPHGYDFNGYLVKQLRGSLVIDPVEPGDEDLSELASAEVSRILITNRNHSRAANTVRAHTGARVAIHPDDARHATAQGCPIDDSLKPGDCIGPLHVVAVPGKSPGEVVLHWPQRKILFVGDAVIGNPPGGLSLLPEAKLDDPRRLRESVRGLLDLDFDVLLPGDGVPLLASAKQPLRDLVAGFPD